MAHNRLRFSGVLLAVAACTSVKPIEPTTFIPAHHPATVWVTYTDNSFVPVAQPRMVGDTLTGIWQGRDEPVVIPLDRIQSVQAKVRDNERTIVLASAMCGVVGLILLVNQ